MVTGDKKLFHDNKNVDENERLERCLFKNAFTVL